MDNLTIAWYLLMIPFLTYSQMVLNSWTNIKELPGGIYFDMFINFILWWGIYFLLK